MPEPDGRSRGESATRLESVQHGETVCDDYMRDPLHSPTDLLFATVFQVEHFSPVMHHVQNANPVPSSR